MVRKLGGEKTPQALILLALGAAVGIASCQSSEPAATAAIEVEPDAASNGSHRESLPDQGATGQVIEVGTAAPPFTARTTAGDELSLNDLRGQPVVLYFYPKDDTPGCTKEACSFRDAMPDFEELGAQIIGVSVDDVASHQAFTEKYQLNFPLLADEDQAITKAYGVLTEREFSGQLVQFASRVTFLIDGDGVIREIWRVSDVASHADEVREAIRALS